MMQHFGLPTRLLDWSDSPLVALYFALRHHHDTQQPVNENVDAAISAIEPCRLNQSQGYEAAFPPLNAESVKPMVRPAFKGDDDSPMKVFAVSPLESDLRMLVQQARFTVHVANEPLNHFRGCEDWLAKTTIPEKDGRRIGLELDLLGVRLADLFPDLQNLSTEIANQHRPGR